MKKLLIVAVLLMSHIIYAGTLSYRDPETGYRVLISSTDEDAESVLAEECEKILAKKKATKELTKSIQVNIERCMANQWADDCEWFRNRPKRNYVDDLEDRVVELEREVEELKDED